jgi:5-hydroxyisourate hydrolase
MVEVSPAHPVAVESAEMGRLTTHVLDTAAGRPAAGVGIVLRRGGVVVAETSTNADGRTDAPLAEGDAFVAGTYEIEFAVGGHFAGEGFLDRVPVRFTIADPTGHYHVPLLCSPWSYSTYRGS